MQGQRPLASRVPLRRLILLLASSVTPHSPAAHLAQSLFAFALSLSSAISSVHLLNSFSRSLSHPFSFSFLSPFPSVFVCLFFPVFPPCLSSQSPRSANKKASYSTQFGIETNRSRRGSKQRIAPHASHVGRHPCPYCCSHFPQSFSPACPLASFLSNCGLCIPVSEPSETP